MQQFKRQIFVFMHPTQGIQTTVSISGYSPLVSSPSCLDLDQTFTTYFCIAVTQCHFPSFPGTTSSPVALGPEHHVVRDLKQDNYPAAALGLPFPHFEE